MKSIKSVTGSLLLLFILSPTITAAVSSHKDSGKIFDRLKIDIEDEKLVFRPVYSSGETVEIDPDGGLFVNGERIALSPAQEERVEEYYDCYRDLILSATELGKKAAKIGLKGAGVGVRAAFGVLEAAFTEYELEELEDDLKQASEELESSADALETEADELEEKAQTLKAMHRELRKEIPALADLSWF